MQLTPKRKTALIIFVVFDILVLVFLGYLLLLREVRREARQNEAELREIGVSIYPQARPLSDFQLLDEEGEFFTRADLQGHWNLLFFGFTHCPDICPLTMAELTQFYQALDVNAEEKPRIFLVTVDPERDNPDTMRAYLANYSPDFIGLSGDPQLISQLASELYVVYEQAGEQAGEPATANAHGHSESDSEAGMAHDNYLINHSGHIAVINPEGDYYAVMRAPHRDQDIATAYRRLIR